MTERAYAQCPQCMGGMFRFCDEDAAGDYADCRFVCVRCGKVSRQMELRGIEYPEVPF